VGGGPFELVLGGRRRAQEVAVLRLFLAPLFD
jgi:hypothetical protein